MGKRHSKLKNRRSTHKQLTDEEYENIKMFFRLICREDPKTGCTYSDFNYLCRNAIDPKLARFMSNYLFKDDINKGIDLKTFLNWHDMLVRGSIDDKGSILMTLLVNSDMEAPIPSDKLMEYLESVVSSYMMAQENVNCKEYNSWKAIKCPNSEMQIKLLAESFCYQLFIKNGVAYYKDLEMWIMSWKMLTLMQSFVYGNLYQIDQSLEIDEDGETKDLTLFPLAKIIKPHFNMEIFPSVLDLCSVTHINYALPNILKVEWRLLYSSVLHGESFLKIVECILGEGPTIIIVKDKLGAIFGGFAPVSWKTSVTFYGNSSSFLFALYPHMRIYEATGKNENYQYFNTKSKVLPNGLAFGGYIGYYGLWLNGEYGRGYCSETCSTYQDYQMLSSKKEFDVHRVEVWAAGAPITEFPSLKRTQSFIGQSRSIYQTRSSNIQMKPVMGMVGGKRYSDVYSIRRISENTNKYSSAQDYLSENSDED